MTVEANDMAKATPADKILMALVGKEKAGKSWLAATARKPILFLDADRRALSLAGKQGVYALTFSDPNYPAQPTAYSEMLDVICSLEVGERELGKITVGQVPVAKFAGLTDKVRTLVFDSVASIAQQAMAYALYSSSDLRRSINVAGKLRIDKPKGWDGWGAEMGMLEALFTRAMAIPNLDVILTLHEAAEESPDSTDESPRFTGKSTVFPVRYGRLLRYFNEVWRVKREGAVPTVQVIPDFYFSLATTALPVTSVPEPSIEKVLAQCGLK